MKRKNTSSTPDASESVSQDQAVLSELRRMNTLLAKFTTRGMDRSESIPFLDASGYSSTQIGEILGVNPVTVRTTLHRARRASRGEAAAAMNTQGVVSRGVASEEEGSATNAAD
jgi:DNA-directed RNA polymerase specialized sigma24 family protein